MDTKTALITGANSGIGFETTRALAQDGMRIFMLCRNKQKAAAAKQRLSRETGNTTITIVLADLANQADIRATVQHIRDNCTKLDILINNAGIIPSKRREAPDGIERTLAINHLAPFLLTNLLLDELQAAPAPRVVTVSSVAHRLGARIFDIDNLQLKTDYSAFNAYGLSKLCNIMFTKTLARRHAHTSLAANCLHPGVVRTQLADEATLLTKLFYFIGFPFMKSPRKGAQTSIYLATSPEVGQTSGHYFKNSHKATPAAIANDEVLGDALWDKSRTLTKL